MTCTTKRSAYPATLEIVFDDSNELCALMNILSALDSAGSCRVTGSLVKSTKTILKALHKIYGGRG